MCSRIWKLLEIDQPVYPNEKQEYVHFRLEAHRKRRKMVEVLADWIPGVKVVIDEITPSTEKTTQFLKYALLD
jgi:hypothetical protein